MKKLSRFFYFVIIFLDKILYFLKLKNFFPHLKDVINENSYKSIIIHKKIITFFIPNYLKNKQNKIFHNTCNFIFENKKFNSKL